MEGGGGETPAQKAFCLPGSRTLAARQSARRERPPGRFPTEKRTNKDREKRRRGCLRADSAAHPDEAATPAASAGARAAATPTCPGGAGPGRAAPPLPGPAPPRGRAQRRAPAHGGFPRQARRPLGAVVRRRALAALRSQRGDSASRRPPRPRPPPPPWAGGRAWASWAAWPCGRSGGGQRRPPRGGGTWS